MSISLTECRRCETDFNLDAQWYYDNLCPSCKAERDGVAQTWPNCIECDERYEPGTGVTISVTNRGMRTTERVTVCSADCARKMEGRRP